MSVPVSPMRAPGRLAVACATAVLLLASGAEAQRLDTVLRWHRALVTELAAPGANPATVFVTRPLAITSLAIFEAANAFDARYRGYVTIDRPAAGASPDAAVAQAARDVLVVLLPSRAAAFDTLLAETLAGLDEKAARDGAAFGGTVAAAVLDLRADDGWQRPFPALTLPSLPGYWVPTPPAGAAAAFTNYPGVTGFIVPNGRQFLPEPPPALTSARYAADLEETRRLGAVDSTERTPEQTEAARLWASVGTSTAFWAVWPQVLTAAAQAEGLDGVETARAFALMHMTHHDALLTSFTGKFLYGLWRPVTAIREAHRDGNPRTEPDARWTPLVPTPPYPGHPGNMACLGAAQARVLERLFGRDTVPFAVTWTGTTGPTVTKAYAGFRQLADEGAYGRIWGGIHFRFETEASIGACSRLADYAVDNVLRAR